MAFGIGTINSIGGAVSDLFAADANRSKAQGYRLKAKGDAIEGDNYDAAAIYADKNAVYAEKSTAIKIMQNERDIYQTIGGQKADIAGAGFSASGSALDLLADSARQGALTRSVITEQGEITQEGYRVQGESYRNLSKASDIAVESDNLAADAADRAANGAEISAGFKAASAVASIFF